MSQGRASGKSDGNGHRRHGTHGGRRHREYRASRWTGDDAVQASWNRFCDGDPDREDKPMVRGEIIRDETGAGYPLGKRLNEPHNEDGWESTR